MTLRLLVLFFGIALVALACNPGPSANIEFISQSGKDGTAPGSFDYAIQVDCTFYNSGEGRGEIEAIAKLSNDFGSVDKKTVGGIAPGDTRTFTFVFTEATYFDNYRYQCTWRETN